MFIDLDSVTIILVIIVFLKPAYLIYLSNLLSRVNSFFLKSPYVNDIFKGVIIELFVIAIIALAIYILYKINLKSLIAGKYVAYDLEDKVILSEEPWGHLELKYDMFSKRYKGVLISIDKTITIRLSGRLEKEIYFSGTYTETSNQIRLRLGAFIMILEPNGVNLHGNYIFLSPDTEHGKAQLSCARWEKIS